MDPFIGTGGEGFGVGATYPGAGLPFGMVKVSPDTRGSLGAIGFAHCAGYWYADDRITGFSHTHLHGTGVPDYGNILFFPSGGMDPSQTSSDTRTATFSHDNEAASPGYYTVTFDDGIRTELTATRRTAFHRYTYPAGLTPTLTIDLEHGLNPDGPTSLGGEVTVDPASGLVEGWMWNTGSLTGRYGGHPVYFSARFSPAPRAAGTWADDAPTADRLAAAGVDLGAWLEFDDPTGAGLVVEAQVGISFTSLEGARGNLTVETAGLTFETARAAAEDTWRTDLSRIRIWDGDPDDLERFYTALFHSLQMPTLLSDTDGSYIGFNGLPAIATGSGFYSDFSGWDTYRTLHPLLHLVYPDIAADLAQSLVTMAGQRGYLPRWPCNRGESGSMVGDPATIILADAWIRGVPGWSAGVGYKYASFSAGGVDVAWAQGGERPGIDSWRTLGFVPLDEVGGSASVSLEYAWADHALARWAEAAGLDYDAVVWDQQALNYINTFDPAVGFFRGRYADGTFDNADEFSDLAWTDDYVEGDAWQYLWMVPQDPTGLADLLGGTDEALARLDRFFEESLAEPDSPLADAWYWHGNEPDLNAAWLYAQLGAPERGMQWIRWIRDTRYTTGPEGLDGNDDGGTLSAWFVLSALGLYPVAGTPTWVLGPPLFERAEVDVLDGVLTVDVSAVASVAQGSWDQASVNGEPSTGTFLQSQIARGGTLTFVLGPDEEPLPPRETLTGSSR